MATKKNERRKPVHPPRRMTKLMDAQDTKRRGDSKAHKTATVTFSTSPDFAARLTEAAHDMRISRSEFIERACRHQLRLVENRRLKEEMEEKYGVKLESEEDEDGYGSDLG